MKTYLKQSCTQQQSNTSILNNDGLKWLITYIDDKLSCDKDTIIFLRVLRSKYRDWLLENDMLNTSCRSYILKKRLNEYSSAIVKMIVPQKGQSSSICTSIMSVDYLLPGCNMVNLVGDRYGVQFSLKEPERVRQ